MDVPPAQLEAAMVVCRRGPGVAGEPGFSPRPNSSKPSRTAFTRSGGQE